jgi:hypothetical protein
VIAAVVAPAITAANRWSASAFGSASLICDDTCPDAITPSPAEAYWMAFCPRMVSASMVVFVPAATSASSPFANGPSNIEVALAMTFIWA